MARWRVVAVRGQGVTVGKAECDLEAESEGEAETKGEGEAFKSWWDSRG